jgi:hypothetical protein
MSTWPLDSKVAVCECRGELRELFNSQESAVARSSCSSRKAAQSKILKTFEFIKVVFGSVFKRLFRVIRSGDAIIESAIYNKLFPVAVVLK